MWIRTNVSKAGVTPAVVVAVMMLLVQPTAAQQPGTLRFQVGGNAQSVADAFNRVQQLLEGGRYAQAERLARQLVNAAPKSPMPRFHLARALARQGDDEAAIEALSEAVDRGFIDARAMVTDPHLASLHDERDFVQVARRAHEATNPPDPVANPSIVPPAAVEAATVEDGVATLDRSNLIPQAQQGFFRGYFRFEDAEAAAPDIRTGDNEIADTLNRWYNQGSAAGNHGDLYDNRDAGHSRLSADLFPQLTHIRYDKELSDHGLHRGAQTQFLYNHVTLGNCSMAMTHNVYWRSLPRMMLLDARSLNMLRLQYSQNHLYLYPSHHDYRADHGDVYHANTPYMIISEGSSGSDQPFLRAVASTLAAFQPEVKRRLTRSGLLMPTVQMILRRSQQQVQSDEDYLRGRAHPTVFRKDDLDVKRMIETAQAMREDTLPPLVRLEVVEESLGELGRDYFAPVDREKMFDTPGAISRIFRSTEHTKRMVVSAENSGDVNDHPLEFHWVVLRGDAERITITPRNDEGTVVEIEVPYHGRGGVPGRRDLTSNRIDIGVFAHNGHHYSAPAFISIHTIPTELRRYSDDGRILSVDYANADMNRRYADPMISLPKDWSDEYFYDGDGRMLGWTRVRGNDRQGFTRDGALVLETDDRGRPTRARTVEYVAEQRGESQPPRLIQQPGDTILHYQYTGPGDPLGEISHREPASD